MLMGTSVSGNFDIACQGMLRSSLSLVITLAIVVVLVLRLLKMPAKFFYYVIFLERNHEEFKDLPKNVLEEIILKLFDSNLCQCRMVDIDELCVRYRNQSTHRGAIKKMKFAPGRGNVKLMLQLSDGVEIWDLGKVIRNAKHESYETTSTPIVVNFSLA